MIVGCDGVARSGPTWSFDVVKALLRGYTQSRVFTQFSKRSPAHFVEQAPATADPVIVKLRLTSEQLTRSGASTNDPETLVHPGDFSDSGTQVLAPDQAAAVA